MPNVVFTPSGRQGRVDSDTTVLDAARQLGVDLDSVCGGRGICGRCQVVPMAGDFAKHGIRSRSEHLSPLGPVEQAYDGRRILDDGARLGCVARILDDVVIDVPVESQMHRPVIRKSIDLDGLTIDPIVRAYFVRVGDQDLGGERSDLRLLLDELSSGWELSGLSMTAATLRYLQPALARGKREVTVAVHGDSRITGIWPGFVDTVFGVAIDVGSTTVAGHLCDLSSGEVLATGGLMNPQIRFGEDLMSRVSYVMMHPGGEQELTAVIREALNDLLATLCEQASLTMSDISDIVLVGNPIMHHLLLGIDPTPLGGAPFPLATDLAVDLMAAEMDLACPFASVHVLACIAGHVGADTVGAVLAAQPHRSDDIVLLVDVGTNAELVLGNRQGLAAASSPTGPAFEGAQISAGQRATAGAIERVRIDRETLEPRLKVIGSELWSNEAGFADSVPEVGITGICGSGIIELVAELFLAGVIDADGTINGAAAERNERIVPDGRTFSYVFYRDDDRQLRLTQTDVRNIQLAKSALYAGARLLMDRAGLDSVDRVLLAGAFGAHIDPVYALVLGLIPDCDPSSVRSIGNAAGSGAVRALLSAADRQEATVVARTITKVETAIEPRFQEHFVLAMGFPHSTDPYPRLSAVVELPAKSEAQSGGRQRRRNRENASTRS